MSSMLLSPSGNPMPRYAQCLRRNLASMYALPMARQRRFKKLLIDFYLIFNITTATEVSTSVLVFSGKQCGTGFFPINIHKFIVSHTGATLSVLHPCWTFKKLTNCYCNTHKSKIHKYKYKIADRLFY